MILKKLLICVIFILTTLFGVQIRSASAKPLGICKIYNEHFQGYVRVHFKLFSELQVGLEPARKNQLFYSDEDPLGVWYFEPASTNNSTTSTFFIRNRKHSQEYLKGSETFQEWPAKTNRAVVLEKMTQNNNKNNEFFMWNLRKVTEMPNNSSSQLFYISNVKLGLPLYARNLHPDKRTSLRILSLRSDGKEPKSDEFKWSLKCREY